MWSLILREVISYAEAHPDQVAQLIGEGIQAGINALKKHNASQKPAA